MAALVPKRVSLTFLCFLSCGCVSAATPHPSGTDGWLVGDTGQKFDTVAKHLRGNDVVMLEVGVRHRELLTGIEHGNWRYADYQLGKIELAMQLGLERRPARRPTYARFFEAGLSPMKRALATRDTKNALAAYDAMTAACVTCHGEEKVEFMPIYFRPAVP